MAAMQTVMKKAGGASKMPRRPPNALACLGIAGRALGRSAAVRQQKACKDDKEDMEAKSATEGKDGDQPRRPKDSGLRHEGPAANEEAAFQGRTMKNRKTAVTATWYSLKLVEAFLPSQRPSKGQFQTAPAV